MAAACLRTCGVTRLSLSDGHTSVASAVYFCTIRSTASRLRRPPRMLVNRGSPLLPSPLLPGRSVSQERSASTLSFRSGVARSFRPLPMHRTCAPVPRTMSPRDRLVSSETLRPVCNATTSKVLSRRPNHVLESGAATKCCHLGPVEVSDRRPLMLFGGNGKNPMAVMNNRTNARQAQRHEAGCDEAGCDGRRLPATTADRRGRHSRLRGATRPVGRRRVDGPRAAQAAAAPPLGKALRHGARIGEVPIVFVERRHGHSKVSLNVIAESLVMPWQLHFRPHVR